MRKRSLLSFYRWGNRDPDRLSNCPQATWKLGLESGSTLLSDSGHILLPTVLCHPVTPGSTPFFQEATTHELRYQGREGERVKGALGKRSWDCLWGLVLPRSPDVIWGKWLSRAQETVGWTTAAVPSSPEIPTPGQHGRTSRSGSSSEKQGAHSLYVSHLRAHTASFWFPPAWIVCTPTPATSRWTSESMW